MQSAGQEFNVYSRFLETDENLYCNIDPRTGNVVPYEHVTLPTIRRMNEYSNSGFNLSSIDSLARRRPKNVGCGERCKKLFKHLVMLDISLKYFELILLLICVCLFNSEIHRLMDTTNTVIVPMGVIVVFLFLATVIMLFLAVKVHVSNIFLIIINTIATLLTSITGGILLGVWLEIPKKIREVLYWESLAILFQAIFSFTAAITYVIDLAWSLNSLNRRT